MFEAVITLCLSLSEGPCRIQLLPGYEAETAALCLAALADRPPDLTSAAPLVAKDTATCRAAPAGLEITEVAPGVFVHRGLIEEPDETNRGDVSNLGFVIGDNSVAVIDSGATRAIAEQMWRAIRARTDKPVSHLILTHMHPDHVFGASVFADVGAEIVAHDAMEDALGSRVLNYRESFERLVGPEAFLGTRLAPVTRGVSDQAELDLGGRDLLLIAWPAAHTGNDLTVLDQVTGTLFAGDLVFHLHTPALDGNLRGWRQALEVLSDLDVAWVVPGHGGPVLSWPDGVRDQQRYLSVLERDTRDALARGRRLGVAVEEIAQDEAGNWALFETYNPRNATVAFTELEWE